MGPVWPMCVSVCVGWGVGGQGVRGNQQTKAKNVPPNKTNNLSKKISFLSVGRFSQSSEGSTAARLLWYCEQMIKMLYNK